MRRLGVWMRGVDRWLIAAFLVAVVPIVVATIRAVSQHWIPIGDNALVAIRSRDVLTANHPWLGTWSSASIDAGVDLNHPGPLLFDALAIPVRLFGAHAGVAIGVMLVNALAAVTVVYFGFRRAGRLGAVLAATTFALLAWALGSELLFDPWPPNVLILPCLALLVCAWSIALGDWWALPVAIAIGSFCVQVHLGYVYLVPGTLIIAFVLWWALDRRQTQRRPRRRHLSAAAATFVVLWAQPLIEQFFGSGRGNLSRLAGAVGSGGTKVGAKLAVRILGGVVAVVPWRARHSFTSAVPPTAYAHPGVLGPVPMTSFGAALVQLIVFGALFAGACVLARRRHDRVSMAALGIAGGALAVAFGSLVIMPVGPIGLTPHQMRWLWAIAVFTWLAMLLTGVRWFVDRLAARDAPASWTVRSLPLGVVLAVAAVLAVATLPTFVQPSGPVDQRAQIPVVAALDRQLGSLDGIGVVWVDVSNVPIFDAYSASIMAELQRRGIPFVVDDPGLVRQVGNRRRYTGHAAVRLYLLQGRAALTVPQGAERVALATPLSTAEQADLLAAERDVVALVAAGGLTLNAAGLQAAEAGQLPFTADQIAGASSDPDPWVINGTVTSLRAEGYLDLGGQVAATVDRYAALRSKAEAGTTVAVLITATS